jgi:hypothetical protein
MIEIHGVTKRQCELLDKMWAIDEYDEYLRWKNSLPKNTRKQVDVLEEIVLAAELDAEEDIDLSDANELIERIKNG